MKKLLAVLALSLLFPMLFACQPQQSGTPNGDGDGQDASDGLQLEHIEKPYIQIEFMESYYMGNLKKIKI